MRITVKYALWLLPMLPFVQGCDHKAQPVQTQTLAPPIVDTPPPKPATVSKADLPPPVIGDAKPDTTKVTPPPPPPPTKPTHHPKKPATPAATPTTAPATTQETASAAPAPSVSAIGTLTGGASGDSRSQTEELINSTEKGVNGITRKLNDSETKTAAQIREFLKQAREALATGDVDGANTLAKKAKVLLSELNQ
jgi:outer membrane biosynthesis protein TonB